MKKTDRQIERAVVDELSWDARVKEADVGVEVNAGVVTLTGTVDSSSVRLAAQEAAYRVSGVLDVANDIQIKLPGSDERNDTEIARAVRMALEWEVHVPRDRIRISVSNGTVTLEGTVDHGSQCDDAARSVRDLIGVREVRNQIAVKPATPSVSPRAVREMRATCASRA